MTTLASALGTLDDALKRMAEGWRRGRNDSLATLQAEAAVADAMNLLALAPSSPSERHTLGMVRSFVARHTGPTGRSAPIRCLEHCVASYDRARWQTLARAWKRPAAHTEALLGETMHMSQASPDPDVRADAASVLREHDTQLH